MITGACDFCDAPRQLKPYRSQTTGAGQWCRQCRDTWHRTVKLDPKAFGGILSDGWQDGE